MYLLLRQHHHRQHSCHVFRLVVSLDIAKKRVHARPSSMLRTSSTPSIRRLSLQNKILW